MRYCSLDHVLNSLYALMITRTVLLFAVAVLTAMPAWAADDSLGNFRDWSAIRFGSSENLACMAFSQPKTSEGDYKKRDPAFVFVTIRPVADAKSELRVSIETGYAFQAESTVELQVDDLKLTLSTRGTTAWLDSDAQSLIKAMRSGKDMQISGTSSRGTKTVDKYSLYGFTAAYQAINKGC